MKVVVQKGRAGIRSLVQQFGRNSVGALASQVVLMGSGLVTVYFLTQTLGRSDYGNYATAIALVYVSAPLLEVGINHLLARSVATERDQQRMWAISLTVHVLGALGGALVLSVIQPLLLPEVPRGVVALLAVSELTGPAVVAGAVLGFEAAGQAGSGARLRLLSTLAKLTALGVFVALPDRTLMLWTALQLLGSLVGGLLTVRFVAQRLGLRPGIQFPTWPELRTGLAFTSSQMAHSGQKDADKVILGYFSLNDSAADYTAGYRFVSLGLIPLKGVMSGTYGQFFRTGGQSVRAALSLAIKLTGASFLILVPVSGVLFLGADLVPALLGDDFNEAADVVRLLSVIPLLKAIQGFANNALVGSGFHGKRVGAVVGTLVINVGLNFLWVPQHGWRGAAWATLVVEALLGAVLWYSLIRAVRNDLRDEAEHADDAVTSPR